MSKGKKPKVVIICPGCGTLQAPLINDKCQVCNYPFYLLEKAKKVKK